MDPHAITPLRTSYEYTTQCANQRRAVPVTDVHERAMSMEHVCKIERNIHHGFRRARLRVENEVTSPGTEEDGAGTRACDGARTWEGDMNKVRSMDECIDGVSNGTTGCRTVGK